MSAQVVAIGNRFSNKARDEELAAISKRKLQLTVSHHMKRIALLEEGNELLANGTAAMEKYGILSPQSKACSQAEREHREKEVQLGRDFKEEMENLAELRADAEKRWGITQ